MTVFTWLAIVPWFVLFVVWTASAAGRKRRVRDMRVWQCDIALRVVVVALVLLAARVPVFGHAAGEPTASPLAGAIGAVFCMLGVAPAIWARVVLGRDWGLPMSRAQDPVLVTSGPYASVRHPIYGGLLVAMLGTAIGDSLVWMVPLVVFGCYFAYSARREERAMLARFPETYAAYRRNTKMFVPFLW